MPEPNGQSSETPHTPRRSRRVQWSLRALALLVLAVAVVFTVISRWQRTGQLHQHIADQLKGSIYIEWKHEDWQWVHPRPGVGVWRRASTVSPWVKNVGAEDLFRRIDRVVINQKSTDDLQPIFEELTRLDHLHDLSLYHCQTSDDQLAQLMDRISLEELAAEGTQLGRGRLPFLKHPTLKHLHLGRTQFSNPAIDDLPFSLVHLNLRRTRITDEGLDQFVRLTNLKQLDLSRTPTSREGIHQLREKMPWCTIQWEPLRNP